MTPIGHLTVSYISGKLLKRTCLPAVIIGGILPDIDFIFIFFDWFNQVHRVITHNILFITFASAIALFFAQKDRKQAAGLSILLGGALHLLIDSCLDNNPTNGIGIALLWPFYNGLFSPFNLLTLSSETHGWNNPGEMIVSLIPNMLYEVPFYFISIHFLIKQRFSAISE